MDVEIINIKRGEKQIPKKLERCIKKVKRKSPNINPYAVCKSNIKKSEEIKIGTRVEIKEHGLSRKISRKIAIDHIKINKYYYSGKIKYLTSKNNGHIHIWRHGKRRTSINSGHSHPINFNKMIANKGRTNHTHKLLKSFY